VTTGTGTTSTGTTGSGTTRTRAADELASLVRPLVRAVAGRLPEIVAGIAVLTTVLAVLAVAGAAVDDRAIAANPAVAEAEVLDGSTFARTLVRFTVANGEAVVPELGVFYPRGLQVGESVAVEYDVTDPELVRVAGRSALDGVLPMLLGVAVVWAVLTPLAHWLRRRRTAARG
jgi:hypothetical protein